MTYHKISILGGGESGTGAAVLAKKLGYAPWLSEKNELSEIQRKKLVKYNIAYEEKGHSIERILDADLVIKSPGINNSSSTMHTIYAKRIPVIDEVEFAYRHKNTSNIIGITGTNGKTTTASLIHHILKEAGYSSALVGNVGTSFAYQVATNPCDRYVVELSSYQLELIDTFRCNIAILLNLTPDHLDRYEGSFEKYIDAKWRIVKNALDTDYFIYNADDSNIKRQLQKNQPKGQLIPINIMNRKHKKSTTLYDENQDTMSIEQGVLDFFTSDIQTAKHSSYNTMAASTAAKAVGIRKEVIKKAIQSFHSIDHRMEFVGTVGGVTFINDSKATNINATWYALESMDKPVVLIMGGQDKETCYDDITYLIESRVKGIVCLGKDTRKIQKAFRDKTNVMEETTSMPDAVAKSFQIADRGDVVLLSPASASFDLFKNYEDRGIQFKQAITQL